MGNKRNKRGKRPHSRRKTSIYRRKLRREAALRLAQENEALERGKVEGDNQEHDACWEGIVKVEIGGEQEEEETADGTLNCKYYSMLFNRGKIGVKWADGAKLAASVQFRARIFSESDNSLDKRRI